ncbi:MAG: DUF3995 domain-containing protein [Pseudaminobacter sp.]|nr:DUF3995 domain-containing protein [Pseudaminobacter sp.]
MTLLAVALALATSSIAALHAYWGFGGVWPGKDAASCARTVTGFKGADAMPSPLAAFAVTAALASTAFVALVLGNVLAGQFPPILWGLAAFVIALVFLGRGVAGFTPGWRRRTPVQPFARLDRLYYSPLCLALGAGFLALAAKGIY